MPIKEIQEYFKALELYEYAKQFFSAEPCPAAELCEIDSPVLRKQTSNGGFQYANLELLKTYFSVLQEPDVALFIGTRVLAFVMERVKEMRREIDEEYKKIQVITPEMVEFSGADCLMGV